MKKCCLCINWAFLNIIKEWYSVFFRQDSCQCVGEGYNGILENLLAPKPMNAFPYSYPVPL